jgi:circadian clock protein KaiB
MSNTYFFKLYITGQTPRSERAIAQLSQLCNRVLADRYQLQIIDVLEQPELAEQDRVLATPTVIKTVPPPQRRIIGDLLDDDSVLHELDIEVELTTRTGDQA